MDFATAPRRARSESIIPMINVVFLLLIFFLMTAQIVPPAPIEVSPPLAAGEELEADPGALYLAANGDMAFGAARGAEVFAALGARGAEPLVIWADARLEAGTLAAVMPKLAALGIVDVQLRTGAK